MHLVNQQFSCTFTIRTSYNKKNNGVLKINSTHVHPPEIAHNNHNVSKLHPPGTP